MSIDFDDIWQKYLKDCEFVCQTSPIKIHTYIFELYRFVKLVHFSRQCSTGM